MEKRTKTFTVEIAYTAFEPGEYVVNLHNNKVYKVISFHDPLTGEDAPMVGLEGNAWLNDSCHYRLAMPEEIAKEN